MIPSWASQYIGIPWVDKGREMSGCDCYGLLRLVKGKESGVWIPSYAEEYVTAKDLEEISALIRGKIRRDWEQIDAKEAQPLDALMITQSGEPYHPGVVVKPPYFLNIFAGTACAAARWTATEWSRRVSFYRYVG
jgi:probable lipoprotein NlpC